MAKKWKNPKVKLLSFQKDLAILLAEYEYTMEPQLQYGKKGMRPVITVDAIPQPPKRQVKGAKRVTKNVKKGSNGKGKKG